MKDILNYLQQKLDMLNWHQVDELAENTKVGKGTIAKIKNRRTLDPRLSSVQPLLDYFKARPRMKGKKKYERQDYSRNSSGDIQGCNCSNDCKGCKREASSSGNET